MYMPFSKILQVYHRELCLFYDDCFLYKYVNSEQLKHG